MPLVKELLIKLIVFTISPHEAKINAKRAPLWIEDGGEDGAKMEGKWRKDHFYHHHHCNVEWKSKILLLQVQRTSVYRTGGPILTSSTYLLTCTVHTVVSQILLYFICRIHKFMLRLLSAAGRRSCCRTLVRDLALHSGCSNPSWVGIYWQEYYIVILQLYVPVGISWYAWTWFVH